MGIRVAHQINGDVLGEAAWASGQAQGMERRREQDRNYSLSQEVNAIREKARQDANARFFAQLQAQNETRDQEMAFRQRQYDELPERQQILGQIENNLRKDFTDFQYSRAQQQQLEKIAQARDYVTRNVDGRYSPGEQENLLRQIDEMEYGIQPLQKKPDTPWPKEQDFGQVWNDPNTGATLTRDEKGNVKVLVQPDDSTSFANQLKLREKIADYAEKLYESRQVSENPISWEDSIKLAQQFYGDLGKPAGQDQPVGNAETMADTILRQIMSPETYAAAKATGLPAVDIYYMAQQLMNPTEQPSAETSTENGDISKDEWMSNNENFNQYRQRFASGIPQSQIEEAYKNDPYVDSNNSALAQADHEVATPYATWEELTDHQREKAYEQYREQNKMPLSHRFGKGLSRLISRSDYKNYLEDEKKHESKLLTEEQFKEKCQENPEFLWQFIKAPNRPVPATIDWTQVDMHRAIDTYRQPVFGGLR